MKNFGKAILVTICALTLACTMEPKYKTPKIDTPLKKLEVKNNQVLWQDFFASDDLKKTIKLALKNNDDLKIANLNIESARAIHGIARSNLLPSFSLSATETRQGTTGAFAAFTPKTIYTANVGFTAFELDFFGRLRSLKKSALEDFLATSEAKNLFETTLIAEVANSYSQLALDQEILDIKKFSLNILVEKNLLMQKRVKNGTNSQIDNLNASAELENAKIAVAIYEKLVTQDRTALMDLVGDFNEKNLPKINSLKNIKITENLLEFIPSTNLLNRPDVRQAERNLKSINANIGAARAAFFPSISLTGRYGYLSRETGNLFSSKGWSFSPQINIPLFSGGRLTASLKNAKILKNIEVIKYQQTIENAFRETLDGLAERKALLVQLRSINKVENSRRKSYQIAKNKVKFGLMNKLDRANYHLEFLAAKENQLILQKEYLTNLIELYKTLGGGSKTILK